MKHDDSQLPTIAVPDGEPSRDTTDSLVAVLRSEDPDLRRQAAHAVWSHVAQVVATGALDTRRELFNILLASAEADPELRLVVTDNLSGVVYLCPGYPVHVQPSLRDALRGATAPARIRAAATLCWAVLVADRFRLARETNARAGELPALQQAMTEVTPLLHEFLHDEEAAFRLIAALILASMGATPPGTLSTIRQYLASPDAVNHESVLELLARLGSVGVEAAPDVLSLLDNQDPEVRKWAAVTLVALGTVTPQVVSALRRVWKQGQDYLGYPMLDLLERSGTPVLYVEMLQAGLQNPEPFVRAMVIHRLGAAGKDALPILPRLLESLGDTVKEVRDAAITALCKLNSVAPSVVTSLRQAVRQPRLRGPAQTALWQLTGDVDDPDLADLKALAATVLAERDKLTAIKLIRHQTGMGLLECKYFVEAVQQSANAS